MCRQEEIQVEISTQRDSLEVVLPQLSLCLKSQGKEEEKLAAF